MLKIRLQRVGRKHEPAFRLVLTDSKNSTKSGRFNEILGAYDPRKKTDLLKTDRIQHWLGKGISVTGSVHNLLVSHKIIDDKKVNVLPKKTPIVKEAPKSEEAPVESPVEENTAAEEALPADEAVAAVEESETAPAEESAEEAAPEAPAETPAEETPVSPEEEKPAEAVAE